eukprot:jgi/Galph1/293/GphlegSOOS_G5032.1
MKSTQERRKQQNSIQNIQKDIEAPVIIAFVNRKSGSQAGSRVFQDVQNLLGKHVVFDMISVNQVQSVLEKFVHYRNLTILACGGDGSCNLLLDVLLSLNIEAALAHIPVGTGNDIARALGWGGSCCDSSTMFHLIEHVYKAERVKVDVWDVYSRDKFGKQNIERIPSKMIGFMSLGVDAQVELCFNEGRWKDPTGYQYHLLNFAKYGWYGIQTFLKWNRKYRIKDFIASFQVDGVPVDIPENIQSIIILNLPSYGAGASPISKKGNDHASFDICGNDGKVEIVGLTSLIHFLLIEMGMSAISIGQGAQVCIELKGNCPPLAIQEQVDGEPWKQSSGCIVLKNVRKQYFVCGPYYRKDSSKFVHLTESK